LPSRGRGVVHAAGSTEWGAPGGTAVAGRSVVSTDRELRIRDNE
jgi:hypothetical protein